MVGGHRFQHGATLMLDGQVLITGGTDENASLLASAELYNPATRAFKAADDLLFFRAWHASILQSPIPEPSRALLLILGLITIATSRRR